MSPAFFDTGVVLKLVVEEPLSPVVRDFVALRQAPVLIPLLVELEMENALQALCFRGTITVGQLGGRLRTRGAFPRRGPGGEGGILDAAMPAHPQAKPEGPRLDLGTDDPPWRETPAPGPGDPSISKQAIPRPTQDRSRMR